MPGKKFTLLLCSFTRLPYKLHVIIRAKNPLNFRSWQYYMLLIGLIAATGGRIWVQNQVDFSKSRNLITAAVALTMGAGNFTLTIGNFTMGGIATATFGAIIIYQVLREREPKLEEIASADSAVDLNPTEPQPGAGQ